jgi:hypothetical protein
MDVMQIFIDFIFLKVWCQAKTIPTFGLGLFQENIELQDVMTQFRDGRSTVGNNFYSNVENIFNHFSNLGEKQIEDLESWYLINNNIENACSECSAGKLIRYKEMDSLGDELITDLKSFFSGLYGSSLLKLSALKKYIGNIEDHFKSFRLVNKSGKCPFCGLIDLKSNLQKIRDAYDHYLPKSIYPFNSINFKNLVPTCHECNSAYKSTYDPITCNGNIRKAFYPFSTKVFNIEVNIEILAKNWEIIEKEDINLQINSNDFNVEIDAWLEVYGIEERYKAKCCSEDDGKEWIVQMYDEWGEDGRLPKDYLLTLKRQTKRKPYADLRFLKLAFLKGCNQAGLFERN